MAKRLATPKQSLGRGSAMSVPRSLVVLVVASLALTVGGLYEGEDGVLHAVRSAAQVVSIPVRAAGSAVCAPIGGLANVFGNLTADSETLSELKAENESLKAQLAELSESEQTAESLASLLNIRTTYSLSATAAHVVSQSTDSWSSTVTIDKGSASGIAVGMPVTSSSGVIGQVSAVSATSATVRLISDENSGVSAMVQSSRAQGQLVGSPDGTLRLSLVRTDQQVAVGDMVVTSGLGGVYPKGLPIGTVTNVTKSSGAMYYDITVEALSSADNLEEVLVVTSVSDEQMATTEEAAAADAQDETTTAATGDGSSADGSTDSSDGGDTSSADETSGGE